MAVGVAAEPGQRLLRGQLECDIEHADGGPHLHPHPGGFASEPGGRVRLTMRRHRVEGHQFADGVHRSLGLRQKRRRGLRPRIDEVLVDSGGSAQAALHRQRDDRSVRRAGDQLAVERRPPRGDIGLGGQDCRSSRKMARFALSEWHPRKRACAVVQPLTWLDAASNDQVSVHQFGDRAI